MDFCMPQPEHVTTGCRTPLAWPVEGPAVGVSTEPCIALIAVKDGCGVDGIR
jgi:hypothetical protein